MRTLVSEPLSGLSFVLRREREEALRLLPERVQVLLASEWATSVLPVFAARRPGDTRPRKALRAAKAGALRSRGDFDFVACDAVASSAIDAAADLGYDFPVVDIPDAAAADRAADAARAAAYAAYTADACHCTVRPSDVAIHAADVASYVVDAVRVDDREKAWQWLSATYRRAIGPTGLVFDPAWRTPTALGLAQAIVEDRALDRLPILADALEEAGCDNAEVLAGLREDVGEWTLADWSLWNLLSLGSLS